MRPMANNKRLMTSYGFKTETVLKQAEKLANELKGWFYGFKLHLLVDDWSNFFLFKSFTEMLMIESLFPKKLVSKTKHN